MLQIANFLVFKHLGAVSMVNLFRRSKKKKHVSKTKKNSSKIKSTTDSKKTMVTLPSTKQSQQTLIITDQKEDYVVIWEFMKPKKEEIRSKPPSSFYKQKTKPAFNDDYNEYPRTSISPTLSSSKQKTKPAFNDDSNVYPGSKTSPPSTFSKQKMKPAFNDDSNEYPSDSTPSSSEFSNPRYDILNEIQDKLEKRRKMIEQSK